MKKNIVSLFFNLIVLLFLFATFFLLPYDYLFVTRIVLIVFTIVFFIIEMKKEYFSANKMVFILVSVVSIIALIISISFDNTSTSSVMNNREFFIPFYVFILIVIMYKDLFDKNNA